LIGNFIPIRNFYVRWSELRRQSAELLSPRRRENDLSNCCSILKDSANVDFERGRIFVSPIRSPKLEWNPAEERELAARSPLRGHPGSEAGDPSA
jgi:hypothetical protein